MWNGYMEYAGNEIINAPRTEAYARHLPKFKRIYKNDSLAPMLGDRPYSSPVQDDAPWVDPFRPESFNFYGVYPLDMSGAEDSSRTSTVAESLGDGGNPGRLRHGTKAVVFSAALIGEDEDAISYGFDWLKQALLPGPCGGSVTDCSGDDMCMLSAEPQVDLDGAMVSIVEGVVPPIDIDGGDPATTGGTDLDGGSPTTPGTDMDGGTPVDLPVISKTLAVTTVDPQDCLTPLLRVLRKVVINSGPTVTAKRTLTDGSAVWTVTWTAVAGEPFAYGAEVPILEGFLDPEVTVPWVGGEVPEGGYIDLDGSLFDDDECVTPIFAPIQDPLCSSVVAPPLPPSVPLGCYNPPKRWRRRQITIPATYIPLWGEVVPKFEVHARDDDLRNLRLRFYADVDGDGDISDDPCAYCGDIVISYLPQSFTLVFDTTARQVYAYDATQQRRPVNELVFSTDGTPFQWPVLTCGMGYIVTLDLPQTQAPPVFDLSLFSRVA